MRPYLTRLLTAFVLLLISAAPKPADPLPEISGLHMYNPPEQIGARFGGGEGGAACGRYFNEIRRVTAEWVAECPKPHPRGIFVAFGIKPSKEVRFWCEALDGKIPAEKLKELEEKLAELPAVPVNGNVAVGLSLSLHGRKPSHQPYPTSWDKAAQAGGKQIDVAPDELFKIIWPDAAAISQVVLYMRNERVATHLGEEGGKDFPRYVKELRQVISQVIASTDRPDAKGIFIGVGLRSKTEARFWCEAVDGTVPPQLLQELEEKLAKVKPAQIKKGPVAFGISVSLYGQTPTPRQYPDRWAKATEASGLQVPAPLERLFQIIWADPATADADE